MKGVLLTLLLVVASVIGLEVIYQTTGNSGLLHWITGTPKPPSSWMSMGGLGAFIAAGWMWVASKYDI